LSFSPYLEVPLTGIGHGQVKLWNVGVNLKLSYQLAR